VRLRFDNGAMTSGLFVPGWGAPASLYRRGLPAGWEVLEAPSFRQTLGDLDRYRAWLHSELAARDQPVLLAGHSMGGALAVLAALEQPERVERLILFSPAGLPLHRPIPAIALTGLRQVLRGSYPLGTVTRMFANKVAAPRATLRLARSVHGLDLTTALEKVRAHGIPCSVVACTTDRLVTCTHCRRFAEVLGADYVELEAPDGHIWLITRPERLEQELLSLTRLP
jgi:pimeloyl-ACP methyl ester carboxylesterase